jgi:Protein of unknown function (DUF2946)
MRRRLEKFLPIVLIALLVQILAPIGSCWAAAIAASDPLPSAEICHTDSGQGPGAGDQGGPHRAHDGACAICCAAQAGAALDTPQIAAIAEPYRVTALVVWRDAATDLVRTRTGSNAQARAPPLSM